MYGNLGPLAQGLCYNQAGDVLLPPGGYIVPTDVGAAVRYQTYNTNCTNKADPYYLCGTWKSGNVEKMMEDVYSGATKTVRFEDAYQECKRTQGSPEEDATKNDPTKNSPADNSPTDNTAVHEGDAQDGVSDWFWVVIMMVIFAILGLVVKFWRL